MSQNINLQNIEASLSSKMYTVHHQGVSIEAIFELESLKVTSKTDNLNFGGVASFTLDTEYGGGPVSVKLEFIVKDGKLILDLDEVEYDQILDWKEIAAESNIMHAYIDDEEDEEEEVFDRDDNEDYDYFYNEED